MAGQTLNEEMVGAINGFNKPSQKVTRVEMGFHKQRHSQLN